MSRMLQLADEAQEIGKSLIASFHTHLAEAKILYVFTDATRKQHNATMLASAQKMGDMARFMSSAFESVESGPDFLILIGINEWSDMSQTEKRRTVDHELCHCQVYVKSGKNWVVLPENEDRDDYPEWKFGLVTHDIEEFAAILERYELPETRVTRAFMQHALPGTPSLKAVS